MKTFTVILFFAVILGCNIEVDAGSFNVSGHLDPGIGFGRRRSHHQKHPARNNEDDDEANSAGPHTNFIPIFISPTSSNDPDDETGPNENKPPHGHHHRSHHRASRH